MDDLIPFDEFDKPAQAAQAGEVAAQPPITPQESVPPQTTPEEPQGNPVLDAFKDTGKAIGRGVEDAGRGLYQTGAEVGNAAIKGLTPPFMRGMLPEEVIPTQAFKDVPHVVDQPDQTINQIAKDVVQFGLGYVGGSAMLKMGGLSGKLPGAIKDMVESGVGTGVVADPNAPRLSNLLEQYPILSGPVTEYLAAKPDDGVALGKFKASLEDMLTTPVAMILMSAVKGLKNGMVNGFGKGGDEADVAEIMKHLDTADEIAKGADVPSKYADNVTEDAIQMEPVVVKGEPLTDAEKAAADLGTGTEVKVGDTTFSSPEAAQAFGASPKATTKSFDPQKYLSPDKAEKYAALSKVDGGPSGSPGREEFLALRQEAQDNFTRSTNTAGKLEPPPKPAIEARNEAGVPVFSMNAEQMKGFLGTVDEAIKKDDFDNLRIPTNDFFNWSKMDSITSTQNVMDAMAKVLQPALTKNVGDVQTFKQIERAANYFGTKPDRMLANLHTWGYDAKEMASTVIAGKMMSQSLADDIFKDARRLFMNPKDDAGRVEMLRKIDILADVEGMTKSIQKAAARTTAAGRIRTSAKYSKDQIGDLINSAGGKENVDDLVKRLSLVENGETDKVAALLRSSRLGKIIDTHNEIWMNGILSGVKTHVVNLTSAAFNTLLQPMNLIAGGTYQGIVKRDWSQVRQGVQIYMGLRKQVFDSMEMARRALASDRAILDPGKGTAEQLPGSLSSRNWGMDPDSWMSTAVDALGFVTRIPSRFLKAEDEFMKQINYRTKWMTQVTGEAADLVRQGKLDPNKMVVNPADGKMINEVQAHINDKFNAGFSPEGAALDQSAIQYARQATFTQDLKADTWLGRRSFSETLQSVANSHPVLRGTVLPFVKVPANLMRQFADMTPGLAQLRKQWWTEYNAGGERQAMAVGKTAMGTMMWTGAAALAIEGRITGAAPGDKDIRDRLTETGWQPYSFVLDGANGKKEYISFSRLDPFGMFFGLAADFHQISHSVDPETRDSWATAATLALAQNLSSKSYLKGIVEMSSMLGAGYSKEEIVARMLQMKAASYIPQYVQLYNGNDELKQVRSLTDALMSRIPGMSDSVEAKRDYFGEKKLAPGGYPWTAINPFTHSVENGDPVRKELARLAGSEAEAKFGMPDTKMGNIDLTQIKNAKGQTAYDRLTELRGKESADLPGASGKSFHDALHDLITNTPRYLNGSDGTSAYHTGSRIADIRNVQERYHGMALRKMAEEFGLTDAKRQDQRNAQMMKHGQADRIQPLDVLDTLK